MSKSLEVLLELKECAECWSEYYVPIGIHERIDEAIAELLAQPEQEPVAWGVYDPNEDMLVSIYGYKERPNMELKERFEWVELYTAPPKREPLSEDEIEYPNGAWRQSFRKGVKFAEKAHGIGVDDE